MAKICGVIALLMLAGCKCETPAVDTSAFLAGLDSTQAANEIYAESIIANQQEHTTALAAIKSQVESVGGELLETRRAVGTMEATLSSPKPNSQEVIKSALEPQEPERDPNITPSISVSAPAVRLQFYTQDFCRDCTTQQPKAEAAAEELGISLEVFDLKEHDHAFEQAKITVTPTTVIVIDDAIRVRFVGVVSAAIIVERAKSELSGTNAVVSQTQITNPVVSQMDLVSIHNQLDGGGNWTSPGNLSEHLRTAHGVNRDGIPANYGTSQVTSQRSSVRLVSRGSPRSWRAVYQTRKACPAGGCP
jgi:predicted SpoU family rRNA methylase